MKKLLYTRITFLNVIIIAIIVSISIAIVAQLIEFTNNVIINPKELNYLNLDKPIIRPYQDVFFYLKPELLENDNQTYQQVQRNRITLKTLVGVVYASFIILLILQLRKLVLSLRLKSFYRKINLKLVRNLSYILFGWVLADFLLYQSLQLFIPLSLVEESINYTPINKGLLDTLLLSVDYSLLLSAFAFYVVSVVFNEGYKLKEQTELTI